jgi:DNA-binding cell septation regulator SpoVG
MKVIEIRKKLENGKPLKAFADIELDSGIVVRELRIIQDKGKRPWVACPQLSWKDPESGQIRYRTIITFPDQLKGEIDLLILNAWIREKENSNEVHSLQ